MLRRLALAVVLAAGCSGGNSTKTDGGPDDAGADAQLDAPGPCWPVDGTTPGGSVVLGTGDSYMPMPTEVTVHYGPQGGFDIPVHAHMTGLFPGDVDDFYDKENPRTRFAAYFVSTGEPIGGSIPCPTRLGYRDVGGGTFEFGAPGAVLFDTSTPEGEIFDQQMRVVVEIIDHDHHYAIDEKIVTCRAPPGWPTLTTPKHDQPE